MTFEELISKIKMEAVQAGVDPAQSPLLDSQILIELVLPRVIDLVTSNVVKDSHQLNALRTNQNVTFASGVIALPVTIKEEYAETVNIISDVGASYESRWWDYINNAHTLFGSFHIANGNIYYRAGGQAAGVFAGTLTLNAVTTPSLPTTAGGTVNIKSHILEQIITTTVAVIRADISLAEIGLDYMEAKDAS